MRWPAIALLVLVVFPFTAATADEDAARYFTRRGRDSLAAGDLDEAEKQFRKAASEAPGFLPAIFGLAETGTNRSPSRATSITRARLSCRRLIMVVSP